MDMQVVNKTALPPTSQAYEIFDSHYFYKYDSHTVRGAFVHVHDSDV